jgi:IMP dehydrogenase
MPPRRRASRRPCRMRASATCIHGELASIDVDDVDESRAAFDLMVAANLEFAPVMHHGKVVGTLSRRSALRGTLYDAAVDGPGGSGRGGTRHQRRQSVSKARALVEAGVDVLVIDTAHGHQEGMIGAVERVASLDLGIPIAAGNVVTAPAVATSSRRARASPRSGSVPAPCARPA